MGESKLRPSELPNAKTTTLKASLLVGDDKAQALGSLGPLRTLDLEFALLGSSPALVQ